MVSPAIDLKTLDHLLPAPCPICASRWAVRFFDGGQAPLATLGWPRSAAEAQGMARHPLDFVRCPGCGHVWNRAFRYEAIPYRTQPNRMFNAGQGWRGHLAELLERLLASLPPAPSVLEIGCGDGHFLQALAARRPGRYVGFDPHGAAPPGAWFAFEARYCEPFADLPRYRPDLIVMRHVLEHFAQPAAFLEQLAWAASACPQPVRLLLEVPCIDRVFTTGRLADFFYEHPQHFSTASFATLLHQVGAVEHLAQGYDGEVLVGLVCLAQPQDRRERLAAALAFADQSTRARAMIGAQLAELANSGKRVAIWGGTGKAAAFMHHYGVDAERFPLVVDSDPAKVGTYVPGSGQRIQFRDVLKEQAVDVLIIPTQWRAWDILAEMQREGIAVPCILIEHQGRLIDFQREPHPYRPLT